MQTASIDQSLKMSQPNQLLFLPGASGNTLFWKPMGEALATEAAFKFVGYPGFGATPSDPNINCIDDLVGMIVSEIDQPTGIVAQSMGGVIATLATLRCPDLVTHLVLVATSGGIDMSGFGAEDWREPFIQANPLLPDWFATFNGDFSSELVRIEVPILLIWGDDDPISPVAVGQKLEELFPNAHLHVVPGGQHDLANTHAAMLAPLVKSHLSL